jgi:hypothetical protein
MAQPRKSFHLALNYLEFKLVGGAIEDEALTNGELFRHANVT